MRTIALLAALAALCACSSETAQPAPEATAEVAAAPTMAELAGIYDYTLEDGAKGTTELSAEGAYVDTEGETVERGTWSLTEDGRTCFDPEGDDPAKPDRCYTLSEPDAEGDQVATAEDGAVAKIRKRPA